MLVNESELCPVRHGHTCILQKLFTKVVSTTGSGSKALWPSALLLLAAYTFSASTLLSTATRTTSATTTYSLLSAPPFPGAILTARRALIFPAIRSRIWAPGATIKCSSSPASLPLTRLSRSHGSFTTMTVGVDFNTVQTRNFGQPDKPLVMQCACKAEK